MRRIKHIIVHHSAGAWGDGEAVVRWHTDPKPKGRGWKYPGYHVVICNGFMNWSDWDDRERDLEGDGRVDRILSEKMISNGCRYANSRALNVCLIGNFDKVLPTPEQVRRLTHLLIFWCVKYGLEPLNDIYGHGEMQKKIGKEKYFKTCPGKNVNMGAVRMEVYSALKG